MWRRLFCSGIIFYNILPATLNVTTLILFVPPALDIWHFQPYYYLLIRLYVCVEKRQFPFTICFVALFGGVRSLPFCPQSIPSLSLFNRVKVLIENWCTHIPPQQLYHMTLRYKVGVEKENSGLSTLNYSGTSICLPSYWPEVGNLPLCTISKGNGQELPSSAPRIRKGRSARGEGGTRSREGQRN